MVTFTILVYNEIKIEQGWRSNMSIETLQATAQLISTVGFPIAVASYSLVVLNKTVQKNTEVMTKIATKLDIETEKA